jgi:thiol:disulfide interchange protein DsbD
VEFKLPPGVTIGAAQWPAPTRHVQPGEMVDYIFEHQLVLIYPLSVSAGVSPGTKATISAVVDWLVCRDVCVPGRATVAADFGIASPSRPSADAGLFAAARKRHPQSGSASSPFTAKWQGLELVMHAKWAQRVAYFPYENDEGIYPNDLFARGEAKGDTLRVTYPEEVRGLSEVRGVLAITRGGQDSFYEVKVAGPAGGSAVRR